MDAIAVLTDAHSRVGEIVHQAVGGLDPEQLAWRADGEANSIAWLVWHLTRVQDDHVAEVAGYEQVWTAAGWYERFGLPFTVGATGYGQTAADVGLVTGVTADLLTGYHDAVAEQTVRYLGTLTDADLDRVVDRNWNPPVTLGARLVSVIDDDQQHAGTADFLRGILDRRA